jgi:uncharacterized linocin/CFP29 family protein|tara:strand:- start:1276 stop:1509 length:234 start_codon:yes stop_codon:yes gene_type:complete
VVFYFFSCQKSNEKCGQIIQKEIIASNYYFILQTDNYINYYNTPQDSTLPDNGVRQGSVSKEIYDAFEIGDEYCSEN